MPNTARGPSSRPQSSRHLVSGIILIGANLRAPVTSIGPVLPDIQAALGLGDLDAGILNALPLLIFAVLSLVAPAVGRRYGLARTLGMALVAIAIGSLLRSLDLPGAIWIGTIILSAGIAFGNVLLPGLVKRDLAARAAGVIGMYASAMAGVAGLAAGLAVPIAHLPSFDWRWSIGVWAALALVAFMLWLPATKGSARMPGGGSVDTGSSRSPWRHAVGWQVSLFFACHSLIFYSLVDWFPSYALSVGISAAQAGYYLLVYQVVAVVTNLACAPLIRRSNDQMLLGFMCGFLLLAGAGGLFAMPSMSVLWIVSAGLGAGLSMTTSLSLFGLRTRDHHSASALSGMGQFIGYIGAAAGPFLFGILHGIGGSWSAPFILLIVASILVVVFATLAGRARYID
jgi:MFS transporter, CP family, cyanate transporter